MIHIPITSRPELPTIPLTRADVPAGAEVLCGRLRWYRGERRRPFLVLAVRCPRCGKLHAPPWRWDWRLDLAAVSYQVAPCDGDPYWLALDPAAAEANARTHQEARDAFLAWQAERKAAYLARTVTRGATPVPLPPDPNPFSRPPVGAPIR